MSQTVEKNFSGLVKVVIGATGLVAMGAVVASGALLKGFKEGAKSVKDTLKNQDEHSTVNHDNATTTRKSEESESANYISTIII